MFKKKCKKINENISSYYKELSKHQKSKCAGKFKEHEEDFIECLKEKQKDKFLIKLMNILNKCSKKNCIKNEKEFYNNLMYSLGGINNYKLKTLNNQLISLKLVFEFLIKHKSKSIKKFVDFLKTKEASRFNQNLSLKYFEEFKQNSLFLNEKMKDISDILDEFESEIYHETQGINFQDSLKKIAKTNVSMHKIIKKLEKKKPKSQNIEFENIDNLIKNINKKYEKSVNNLLKKTKKEKLITNKIGGAILSNDNIFNKYINYNPNLLENPVGFFNDICETLIGCIDELDNDYIYKENEFNENITNFIPNLRIDDHKNTTDIEFMKEHLKTEYYKNDTTEKLKSGAQPLDDDRFKIYKFMPPDRFISYYEHDLPNDHLRFNKFDGTIIKGDIQPIYKQYKLKNKNIKCFFNDLEDNEIYKNKMRFFIPFNRKYIQLNKTISIKPTCGLRGAKHTNYDIKTELEKNKVPPEKFNQYYFYLSQYIMNEQFKTTSNDKIPILKVGPRPELIREIKIEDDTHSESYNTNHDIYNIDNFNKKYITKYLEIDKTIHSDGYSKLVLNRDELKIEQDSNFELIIPSELTSDYVFFNDNDFKLTSDNNITKEIVFTKIGKPLFGNSSGVLFESFKLNKLNSIRGSFDTTILHDDDVNKNNIKDIAFKFTTENFPLKKINLYFI